MFEKMGRLAEKAATNVNVSRRGFLGRLGAAAALTVGALLGFAASSAEGRTHYTCCRQEFWGGVGYYCYPGGKCPPGASRAPRHCGGRC
jgi:hypothetical protein